MYAPGLSPSGSYSVVRVRIPLSALAQGSRLEGTIEADLLVGEDGLASGIRFASTDTLVVSTGSPCCGERR
jgi:2-polyprenyl-6-methoxyphenol hydroxylase-like FAD-dependent oxidoreductase